jgi:eukaryotic-like serine/threonine-protein kinase
VSTQPSTIGRYQVVRRLGVGGMGSVFLARDPELDRPLAIKVVKDDLTDDPELRERFVREARSAARLRHPNIITVFDIGDVDGRPFIAMEYVPGESVADIIRRRGPLDVPRVLGWMEQLCAGLGHAHRSGIVHRDIKPGNLMVDPEGALKIVDFGIARLGDSQLTREGMLVGTANYMAPEQLSGGSLDHRLDIFAVGAVFYELLTYNRAFPGTIADGLFNRICYEPPPPLSEACPQCEPAVAAVVERALEKDPARRYPDLQTMGRDVASLRGRFAAAPDAAPSVPPESALETMLPTFTPVPGSGSRAGMTPLSGVRPESRPMSRPGTPAPPMLTPPPPSHPTPRSIYDVGSRPSGGFAAPPRLDSGVQVADDSLSQRQRRLDLFLDAAEMALTQRDFAKASSLLDDAERVAPGAPEIAPLRAQLTTLKADAEQADARRQRVAQFMSQAVAAMGRGEFAAAREAASQAAALDPDNWDAQSLTGRIVQAESSARQRALREAQEAERLAAAGRRSTLWIGIGIGVVVVAAVVIFLFLR